MTTPQACGSPTFGLSGSRLSVGAGVVPLKLRFGRDIGRGANLKSAKYWSEWQDLNLRPPRPERGSGPAEFASAFASELLSTGQDGAVWRD